MNGTITDYNDIASPVLVYAILGIEFLNTLITAYTSYKLGHLEIKARHISVCCCSFDDIDIDISDSEESKKNKQKD